MNIKALKSCIGKLEEARLKKNIEGNLNYVLTELRASLQQAERKSIFFSEFWKNRRKSKQKQETK